LLPLPKVLEKATAGDGSKPHRASKSGSKLRALHTLVRGSKAQDNFLQGRGSKRISETTHINM
jgi:hypothetical protein